MGGIPGTSRGCNTCRKRKKGCDQKRPACGQCIKAGIECAGYDRQRIFVNASNEPAGSRTRTTTGKNNHALTVTRVSPLQAIATASVTSPHGLARSAYEIKYMGLFWEMYLPGGTLPSDYYLQYSVGSWTKLARELYSTEPALKQTLQAMCLTTLGHRNGEPDLMKAGLQHYVAALGEMNAALRNEKRRKSDALLIAARTLGLWEMLYGNDETARVAVSQANSWQGHSMGELALIAHRAPEVHIDEPAHQLFCDGRMGLIIAAINVKKRTYLSEPQWKTIPWTKIPKSPKDILWDILADIPGFLEDVETLESLPDGDPEKAALYQRLLQECWRLDGELAWWNDNLSPRDHFAALQRRGFKNLASDDQAVASLTANFWTCCLIVYFHLRSLLEAHPAFAPLVATLSPRTDPMYYCGAIGDILDVFIQPSAGKVGLHLAPFPAGIAAGYLLAYGKVFSPEMEKFRAFFNRGEGGKQVGLFLKSMLESGYGKWPDEDDAASSPGSPGGGFDTKSIVLRSLGERLPSPGFDPMPDIKVE